jgi:hypothetical protein
MKSSILSFAIFAASSMAGIASAAPLDVVNVGAPAINCVFDPACTLAVASSRAGIPLPGIAGAAVLESRTFVGSAGAPGAGLTGYMYRVNLATAAGRHPVPCVQSLTVSFGPVSALPYDGAGPIDHVFVVTAGGPGTIGLSSADQVGNDVIFTFSSPVCAGSTPDGGATSFLFGLASIHPPTAITASATPLIGAPRPVGARAPDIEAPAPSADDDEPLAEDDEPSTEEANARELD